jgi:hypothetical protein
LPNKARPSSSPSTSTTTTTKRQGEGIMFESFQVIFQGFLNVKPRRCGGEKSQAILPFQVLKF